VAPRPARFAVPAAQVMALLHYLVLYSIVVRWNRLHRFASGLPHRFVIAIGAVYSLVVVKRCPSPSLDRCQSG
jgi:hypothetical protein